MPRAFASDEPELEPDLPPLDPEPPDGEDAPAEIDLTDFVDTFDREPDLDLDDEQAPDLDVGIAVADADDGEEGDDKSELVLDIAELLAIADEDEEGGDEAGPIDFEPGLDVDELPETAGDGDEGSDELLEGVVSEDLPSIDADEEGEATLEDGWAPELWLDEAPPPVAARQWDVEPLLEGVQLRALVAERGSVVAGGAAIHVLGRGQRRIDPRAAVVSLALSGGSLLYFTARGELFRQPLEAADGERLDDWLRAAGARPLSAVSLELGAGGSEPGVLLARTSHGLLLRSRDRGTTFSVEDLHASVLALDARSLPAVGLAKTSAGRRLIVSSDAGSSWQALVLDAEADRVASGTQPLIAASGELVALADPDRALVVSADGGQSFSRVGGSARATALAIGERDARPVVFAALHDETEELTSILVIDPGSAAAEIVARVGGDATSGARVEALVWDGSAERLLAAGGFGLVQIVAPRVG